ncbi:MAG: hypothetical protein DME91_08900 [Verrucomicrobia bacterium]|nr:MAG: hypothetical protein DME91_08900 [Verrucomicrobiota bacterium]
MAEGIAILAQAFFDNWKGEYWSRLGRGARLGAYQDFHYQALRQGRRPAKGRNRVIQGVILRD